MNYNKLYLNNREKYSKLIQGQGLVGGACVPMYAEHGFDPLSRKKYSTIPKDQLIRIKINNITSCVDIIELVKCIQINHIIFSPPLKGRLSLCDKWNAMKEYNIFYDSVDRDETKFPPKFNLDLISQDQKDHIETYCGMSTKEVLNADESLLCASLLPEIKKSIQLIIDNGIEPLTKRKYSMIPKEQLIQVKIYNNDTDFTRVDIIELVKLIRSNSILPPPLQEDLVVCDKWNIIKQYNKYYDSLTGDKSSLPAKFNFGLLTPDQIDQIEKYCNTPTPTMLSGPNISLWQSTTQTIKQNIKSVING
jgi:hypothetical protein